MKFTFKFGSLLLRNYIKIALIILLILITIQSSFATIDLATPQNNLLTNENSLDFSAYVTPVADNCSLVIDEINIDLLNNAQGLITINAGPDDGYHNWKFVCSRSGVDEESLTRNLTIDSAPPQINLVTPIDNDSASLIELNASVQDDNSFECQISLGEELLSTINGTGILNYSEELIPKTLDTGNYSLIVSCTDVLGNQGSKTRLVEYVKPIEPLFVNLTTDSQSYALGESAILTIDSVEDANLSLEICPDEQGFVECYTPLIETENPEFPLQITLPTTKAGSYLVDAYATRVIVQDGKTNLEQVHESLTYNITNTIAVSITTNKKPMLDREIELTATASNGIGDYNYTWTLSNGSIINQQTTTKLYDTLGTITDKVLVTDEKGNSVEKSYSADITPIYKVFIDVKDSLDKPLVDAIVQIGDDSVKTNDDGEAFFELADDEYEIYVGKTGYDFYFEKQKITEDKTIDVVLNPDDKQPPKVNMVYPVEGQEVPSKINVKFELEENNPKTCTLLGDNGADGWFTEKGSLDVQEGGEYEFKDIVLSNKNYVFKIECVDQNNNKGSSAAVSVVVNPELVVGADGVSSSGAEGFDNASLKKLGSDYSDEVGDYELLIDDAYTFLDSLSEKEQEAAHLLGIYDDMDSYSREVSRIARDINDLQFRRDLSQEERDSKNKEYNDRLKAIVSQLPSSIKVTNSKTLVKYLKEEDLSLFAENYISANSLDMKPSKLVKLIMPLQQKYTSKMSLMNVEVVTNSETKDYTIAGFKNDFGQLNVEGMNLLFEIPEEFATNSRKILGSDSNLKALSESPLIMSYDVGSDVGSSAGSSAGSGVGSNNADNTDSKKYSDNDIVFYVEKKVELSKVSNINEILFKESLLTGSGSTGFTSGITGAVTGLSVDWTTSIYLSLALIVILFLVGVFWAKLKYFVYELSPKKKTHYLRVLANDAIDKLQAGTYDKANMIYEELRLEYERADELVQNDVYNDVMKVCSELDQAYLMQLTNKIGEELKNNNLESAIDDFEKLEGTYARLNDEQKLEVEELVEVIASKLGMV